MPKLGLGNASSSGSSMITPGIITDSLVMKHMYPAGAVQPLSDGALYFDGAEYVDLGETTTVSGAFSVAGWFFPEHVTSNYIMGVGSTDYLRITSATEITLRINNSGKTFGNVTALTEINTNEWIHVALTRDDSDDMRVYLNGVEQEEDENEGDDWDYRYICSRDNGGAFAFDGYTCNLGIWSDALTLAEIKSIMWKRYEDLTAGTDSESDDLVSWWALDEGEGTTATDSHGSNDGSVTFV